MGGWRPVEEADKQKHDILSPAIVWVKPGRWTTAFWDDEEDPPDWYDAMDHNGYMFCTVSVVWIYDIEPPDQ